MDLSYYGTVDEANEYFDTRLHAGAWFGSDLSDRPKALADATRMLDGLNYKGSKHTVWLVYQKYQNINQYGTFPVEFVPALPNILYLPMACPTPEELQAAEEAQALEFPRDSDTDVPQPIRLACYELARSLLEGKDPEREIETLGILQQSYNSVQTTYSRNNVPLEHIINGIPSIIAWRLIRPFLRSSDQVKLSRIS